MRQFTNTPISVIFAVLLGLLVAHAQRPDILIMDFEGSDYGDWWTEGIAFGSGPTKGTLPGQMKVSGFEGQGLVSSFHRGDRSIGVLTSPVFKIERKFVNFLIGGGGWEGRTCMNLIVDGKVVRTATGTNKKPGGSEALVPASWNVVELEGQSALIQIVDIATMGWGHINVDHIVASDTQPLLPQKNVTRVFTVDKKWLLLPVKNGHTKCDMELRDGTTVLRAFGIELAAEQPDWWAPLDIGAWQGKKLTLWANQLDAKSKGMASIRLTNTPSPYPADLYQESQRPQLHFSPARGWNNDPNGMVYYNGEYHLFFQHNPYGVKWGNMHWGHAVSSNLVHWQQLGEALYPDEMGTMYSGSAVVDHNNTSGFGRDGKAPMVLFYTAAGNPFVQGMAYSLDGRSFTKYDKNPIVKNITSGNRDPKVFWHEPSQKWVMVLYVGHPNRRHTMEILISENLHEWQQVSVVEGDNGKGNYLYECPDLFELPVDGMNKRLWVLFGADGQYALGSFDGKVFTPEKERLRGHWGNAYYAAQTFDSAPDGQRILMPWLRADSPGMPFNQCMGIPQLLGLANTGDGVRLTRRPVEQFKQLRQRGAKFGPLDLAAGGGDPLKAFKGEIVEVSFSCQVEENTELVLNLRGIEVVYNAGTKKLRIGKHESDWPIAAAELSLTLFLDRTSIEVFSGDGLLYAPVAVIPADDNLHSSLSIRSGGVRRLSGEIFSMGSIWQR